MFEIGCSGLSAYLAWNAHHDTRWTSSNRFGRDVFYRTTDTTVVADYHYVYYPV